MDRALKQVLVDYREGKAFRSLSTMLVGTSVDRGDSCRKTVDHLGHAFIAAGGYLFDTRMIENAIEAVLEPKNEGKRFGVDEYMGSLKYSDHAFEKGVFLNFQNNEAGLAKVLLDNRVLPHYERRDVDVLNILGDAFNSAVEAGIIPLSILAAICHVLRQVIEKENDVAEEVICEWVGGEVPENVLILDKFRNKRAREKSKQGRASPLNKK